ncbi:hypothetical protein [Thiolinea disciformis]|uniref:hypothetical protein n=1 Tax=Thiolinea disciformis TaxID=125614 RepID=UPI00036A94AA|nr:hypothetical protein [Thiolinea disciformis]
MSRLVRLFCIAFCFTFVTTPALAAKRAPAVQTPETYWQKNWSCGHSVKPDKRLVHSLLKSQGLHSVVLQNKVFPILVGHDLEKLGTVLFIQSAQGTWRMIPMAQGERLQGISSSASGYNMMFFSMWMSEGPGSSYTLLRTRKGFTEFDCQSIPFPKTLNKPAWGNEFLDLVDVNINAKGEGTLVGVVALERDGKTTQQWYQYKTNNWGQTWSEAVMVKPPVKTPLGVFFPAVEVPARKAQIESLLRSSR